jgi:RHS repeat-associated protein
MAGISDQALSFGKYNNYRYNGKEEQHKEFSDGSGLELYDYTYRFYDNQLGRFVGVDHLASKFPYYSPYQFAGNQVPNAIDLDELEPLSFHQDQTPITGADGNPMQDFTYSENNKPITVHPIYDPGSGNNYFTYSDQGNNFYWKTNDGSSDLIDNGNTNGAWTPYQTAESKAAEAGVQVADGLAIGFSTAIGGAIDGFEIGFFSETSTVVNFTTTNDASNASGFGDLTNDEVGQIQGVVDQAERPIEVGGSAANGTRRGVGTDLPIGKGPGTKSDIDYFAPPSSLHYFDGLQENLPSLDPHTGIVPGSGNPYIGPTIRFEPGAQPTFTPLAN